jgi:hypothetical protein
MKWRTIVGLLCAAMLAACDASDSADDITKYGLDERPLDWALVQASIDVVNTIVAQPAPVVLAPGWRSARTSNAAIRVFAVGAQGLSRREMVAVYAECRCVVVKAGELQQWLNERMGSGQALLSVDLRMLLA